MEATMKLGEFTIRRIRVKEQALPTPAFRWLVIFMAREFDAVSSLGTKRWGKNRPEVQATNAANDIRALNTQLTPKQLGETETCFRRLGGKSLTLAVDLFLDTCRPPLEEKPLARGRRRIRRLSQRQGRRSPPRQCRE